MNTRHSLRTWVLVIPVLLLLAMVSIARAAGNDLNSALPYHLPSDVLSANGTFSNTIVLTDIQGRYPLGLRLGLLDDPTGKLTIDKVTSPANSRLFTPSTKSTPVYGYTDSAIWVRFTLDNQSRQTTEYLLEMSFPNTQYIDLYSPLPAGEGFEVKHTGALLPPSSRDVISPDFVFNVNVPLHNTQTYYLRIKSEASMTIPLTLWTNNTFFVQSTKQIILHWLILGGLFALLLYHVFLSIRLREATYIYFVVMLACMLIFLLDYSGYLTTYLFPGLYILKYHITPLSLAGLYLSIILFSDAFLDLRTKHLNLHRVNIALLVAWGVFVVINPFISYLNLARLSVPLQYITLGATWVVGILAWRKGAVSSQFFMFAWLGMAASLLLLLLVRAGIIPSTSFDENIFQLGLLLMAVSWSIALADRIKILKDQTENANRDLRNSEGKLAQILDGLPLGIVVYDRDQKPTYINKRSEEILSIPERGIIPSIKEGRNLQQAIDYYSLHVAGSDQEYPLERHPVYQALQGSPASVDDMEINRGDDHLLLEQWANPIKDVSGNVVSAVVAFQDITQRKQAEAELLQHRAHLEELVESRTRQLDNVNRKLELRLDWLSTVIKYQQTIQGEGSLPEVYTGLASKAQNLLDMTMVFILRWDYKTDQPLALFNLPHGIDPVGMDFIYEAFKKDSPLRKHFEGVNYVILSVDDPESAPEPFMKWFHDHNFEFMVVAPMLLGQLFLGSLCLTGLAKQKDEIVKSKDLVERMAFDLASLTQDAILLDDTIALVASEERNRLARDLHDSVTQMLFTATLLTDVLPQIWRRDPEQGFQTLDKLRRLTRGALAEMRTLLIELRPSALHNLPLSELLSQLTEAMTSRSGVPFKLSIEKIPMLPDDVQEAFYRIAQEALNNVVKHAQAISAMVSLSVIQLADAADGIPRDQVKLVVQDDGVGYLTSIEKPGHLGIGIMRERAAAIQAALTIESRPGHGTLVSLVWTGEVKSEQ